MTAIDERAQEIGANFLAWTINTGPCPIDINDSIWFRRLCGLFETQAQLEAELAQLREAKEPCQWELIDDMENIWRPSCDEFELWHFEDGRPEDNHVRFCPFCGRRLVVVPPDAE